MLRRLREDRQHRRQPTVGGDGDGAGERRLGERGKRAQRLLQYRRVVGGGAADRDGDGEGGCLSAAAGGRLAVSGGALVSGCSAVHSGGVARAHGASTSVLITNGAVASKDGHVYCWGGNAWEGGICNDRASDAHADVVARVAWSGVPPCYACKNVALGHNHGFLLFEMRP